MANIYKFDPPRVLVTGGAGFLGSHLCERLVKQGSEVLCVDNFYTGRRASVGHLLEDPRFELLRHDVTFPLYVEADEIYNLACPASPVHYQHDPVQTTKTSVHGAINMLGLAKRLDAKILQASTSEIYGDPAVHPQTEEYWGNVNTVGPRACYDEGKRCAETLYFDYHRQHGLRIKVARIFNTYGPRMHPNDGRVVSNFIMQALQGEPITVYGEGGQTRSFCYVSDLVDGLVRLMSTPDEITGPINLGNPNETTILELADGQLLQYIRTNWGELWRACSEDGGVYVWVKEAYGERLAFVAVWQQWIENVIWLPSILTVIVVAASIAWIPLIRYLDDEIYQYLQSVQAYIGAPITATFLTGILWRGATARAALTTLLFGGCIGGVRFLLDILHKAMGYDLGALNAVVEFSFLNFSVIVFFVCVGLMVVVSRWGEKPLAARVAGLTVDWFAQPGPPEERTERQRLLKVASGLVAVSVLILWHHFR
ncbi:MAG: NAD-dependent epimerase/dehydratase family protein [Proteobacteria bacterium]|nr:NAD-dependent epimerase/dehydratase family protein [Pseudomonadota bacterium]